MPAQSITEVDNKRDSFRCPVPELRNATVSVDVAGETLNSQAFVFDESAGGYGLFVNDQLALRRSDQILLLCKGKKAICEVTRAQAFSKDELAEIEEMEGFQKVGVRIIEEMEEAPEKQNAARAGRPTYFTSRAYFGPMMLAASVLILAVGGFIYHESTQEYRDDRGRKVSGSPSTAFNKLYNTLFGDGDKEKNRRAKGK